MIATMLALAFHIVVTVDNCNLDVDTCYVSESKTFRAATVLVAQHGTLVAQRDTLMKLDSLNHNVISTMATRIQISDTKSSKQDSIIAAQDKSLVAAKIRYGVIGFASGFVVGIIATLITIIGIQ